MFLPRVASLFEQVMVKSFCLAFQMSCRSRRALGMDEKIGLRSGKAKQSKYTGRDSSTLSCCAMACFSCYTLSFDFNERLT